MRSMSIGFTKRMLATVASICSAACKAGCSMLPNASSAMRCDRRFASRRSSPFPIGSARISRSIAMPGPAPRG